MENIKFRNSIITCICPDCSAITNFNFRDDRREYGSYVVDGSHNFKGQEYSRIIYRLYRCSGCDRGGVAKIHASGTVSQGEIEDFYPVGIEKLKLPSNVPEDIIAELREAELCASICAWRAGSAMLRSVLDKVFTSNGYNEKKLYDKIEAAKIDGIITDSRAKKAHDDVRVLGNDILHDEWKVVTSEEFNVSYHYCQRIIEDFYDDRVTIERKLRSVNRL